MIGVNNPNNNVKRVTIQLLVLKWVLKMNNSKGQKSPTNRSPCPRGHVRIYDVSIDEDDDADDKISNNNKTKLSIYISETPLLQWNP